MVGDVSSNVKFVNPPRTAAIQRRVTGHRERTRFMVKGEGE
jgi:hypothetical protein